MEREAISMHFKRHAQTLLTPSRTLCEHHCRTKPSPLSQHHGLFRPRRPITSRLLYPSCSPIRSTSTSHADESQHSKAAGKVILSVGQPADLPDRVAKLLPLWRLSTSNKGITRQFNFSSFSKAWKFMTLIADECKTKKHHPSWSNLYSTVTIEWTTHKPEGLSIKDAEMAEFCNQVADEIGLKQ